MQYVSIYIFYCAYEVLLFSGEGVVVDNGSAHLPRTGRSAEEDHSMERAQILLTAR